MKINIHSLILRHKKVTIKNMRNVNVTKMYHFLLSLYMNPFILNSMRLRFLFFAIMLFFSAKQHHLSAQDAEIQTLVISEFMAINGNILADEDGDFSDWIELYNPGNLEINLDGWYLTDNPDNLNKWRFPAITIQPGNYLVVFASEKSRKIAGAELHTNFKLSGSGEFLALVKPDMVTITFSFGESYPVQRENSSYGSYNGNLYFFEKPTPGAANSISDQILTPRFSVERGFCNEPFTLNLSVDDPGLQIYYTTDGTRPGQNSGTFYTGPLTIGKTTPVSAVARNAFGNFSDIVSNTYLFVNDIKKQPANPAGYPAEWSPYKFKGGNAPADYEMDPEICNSPAYKDLIDDALKAIPSLCVVTNVSHLFSHDTDNLTGGIYIYTGSTSKGTLGSEWERPTSIEYIDPVLNKSFQLNCGIRLHGGNSRVPENSQKHSFRISFRGDYGPTKLNYNLFDDRKATNSFDDLVLRAGYNYSWTKNDETQRTRADFMRDAFAKNSQLDLGNPSAHNKFVHLYLNGLYWGVYDISEKITADFMNSYMGGTDADWDVIREKSGVADGNITAWNKLISMSNTGFSSDAAYQKVQGNNPDGSRNAGYENLLDVDNLIDYMIYNIYIGNVDWDHNNWLAARNRVEQKYGFRFFAWDSETSMIDVTANMTGENNSGNPSSIYTKLQQNKEFRVRFGDRLQKHFFNDGAMTPTATAARYQELASKIELAIVGESARWGDYRRDVMPSDNTAKLYTRNDFWLPEVNNQLTNYFPYRSGIVLDQFRQVGLFPNLAAPEFSHPGGKIEMAIDLEISAPEGEIYYTTDNSDPRETGGAIALPEASMYLGALHIAGKGTIRARTKKGTEWSALSVVKFDHTDTTQFVTRIPQELAAVKIQCYPNPFSQFTTIRYSLQEQGNVEAEILDLHGRLVEKLYSGKQHSGNYSLVWYGTNETNGLYFYRIRCNGAAYTGKIILNR